MKVLVTGATGYLGKAIVQHSGFSNVVTLSRTNADINCNLESTIPKLPPCGMVIHAAGKAHSVPRTDVEKELFFSINVVGTQNLLRALDAAGVPNTFVFISSVAVYGAEQGVRINEKAPLNAKDPYGASKIAAEEIVLNWCAQNQVHCIILRLPLIVGANPPGNLGSMIAGIRKGYYLNIGGGKAKRSGILLEDLVALMPVLHGRDGIYNLTDGEDFSYNELGKCIAAQLNRRSPKSLPYPVANLFAKAGDLLGRKAPFNSYKLRKLTSDLTFDNEKARTNCSFSHI